MKAKQISLIDDILKENVKVKKVKKTTVKKAVKKEVKKEVKKPLREQLKEQGYITVKEISEQYNLSQKYIRNIIRKNDIQKSDKLNNKGYVFSKEEDNYKFLIQLLEVSAKNKEIREAKKAEKLKQELSLQ